MKIYGGHKWWTPTANHCKLAVQKYFKKYFKNTFSWQEGKQILRAGVRWPSSLACAYIIYTRISGTLDFHADIIANTLVHPSNKSQAAKPYAGLSLLIIYKCRYRCNMLQHGCHWPAANNCCDYLAASHNVTDEIYDAQLFQYLTNQPPNLFINGLLHLQPDA